MLKENVIRQSRSPWVSQTHLVKKSDNTFCFCLDFCPLNKVTIRNEYPLPRIDDILDSLAHSQYFTSLDLKSGYWLIPMKEEDKCKTAFRTPFCLYEFNVMAFGLSNAPSSFQRMMNFVLHDLIVKGKVVVYLDDVLIHTSSLEEHLLVLEEVLVEFNLRLN
eukprot:c8245_g1_i2 orf=485-970(-)